jgi:hypothetical protein
MSKQVIICKYRENINWVHQLTCDYLIHNKSGESLDIPNAINIPNYPKGRDAHSIIYHLYHNYDNLADETIFLQDNPFEHFHMYDKNNINEIIKYINKNHKELFYPFGSFYKSYIFDDNLKEIYQILFNKNISNPLIWFPCQQFHVSKECVYLRSRDFYKKCYETFDKEWEIEISYLYEHLWLYIFLPENKFLRKIFMKPLVKYTRLCHDFDPQRYHECEKFTCQNKL